MNILNIDKFVVGGRVADAGDLILGPARKQIAKRAIGATGKQDVIVQARLRDNAGIIGAAGVVFQQSKGMRTI